MARWNPPKRRSFVMFLVLLFHKTMELPFEGYHLAITFSISFPESTFPLSSGTGNKRLWDKAFSDNSILVIPVELRRRECVFQDGLLAESAYSSTFHKAIEFSLKKVGKPKLELRTEQYDAIRAICFERKEALAVLPTGFRKSLIYREFYVRSGCEPERHHSVVLVVSP